MAPIHESPSKTMLAHGAGKPKKIYIPIRVQTNAINTDDIAINASYLSFEDLTDAPSRKTTSLHNRVRDAEIRYLDHIRSFKDKFKSTYSCSQKSCPMMKERLKGHQVEHHADDPAPTAVAGDDQRQTRHADTPTVQHQPLDTQATRGFTETENRPTTAEPKRKSVAIKPEPIKRKNMESRSMQTPSKFVDFTHGADNSFYSYCVKSDHVTQSSVDCIISTNKTNQASETTSNNISTQHIENIVMEWFEDIPIFPNLSISTQDLRKGIKYEFIQNITNLTNQGYLNEETLKTETDKFLRTLPMWHPGAKREQDVYKDRIKNSLLMKIKDLRLKDKKVGIMEVADNLSNKDGTTYFNNNEKLQVNSAIEKNIRNEILEWLMSMKFKENYDDNTKINFNKITDIFAERIMPVLNRPVSYSRNHKIILRGVVLNTLNNMSDVLQYPENKRINFHRLTEDLANRLLNVQFKYKNHFNCIQPPQTKDMYQTVISNDSYVKLSPDNKSNIRSKNDGEFEEDAPDMTINCLKAIFGKDESVSDEETYFLDSNDDDNIQAKGFSDPAEISVVDILTNDILNETEYINFGKPILSGIISIYTSENDLTDNYKYPITSTPKKDKTLISKLNPEETTYMNNISEIIRNWMDTLSKNLNDDKKYKEIAVIDLAGDIMDQAKIEQLAPKKDLDKNKVLFYIICRWLYRFDLFEDVSTDYSEVDNLIKLLDAISVPVLTRPQHGNRQAISLVKHREAVNASDIYLAKGKDILGDEISVWLNNQPSEIFVKSNKDKRHKMVNEIAETLENRLINKRPEEEIKYDVMKWLKKIIVPSRKNSIDKLTNDLKNKIIGLPQDDTLNDNLLHELQIKIADKANQAYPNKCVTIKESTDIDVDSTLKEFIAKYMEHNYDVDDTFAQGAFAELLKKELRKFSPPTRKEIYNRFNKSNSQEVISKEKFDKELQFIKIVSDWLKNIPIDNSFNRPQNKERIDFVNDIAKNISELEEERQKAPLAMDYDIYLESIISQLMHRLPILPEQRNYTNLMIKELVAKVIASRNSVTCCLQNNQSLPLNDSSGIQEQNIGEFLKRYIHLNAAAFADDQMKIDAWSARILKEVKRIAISTSDPTSLCKTEIYNKLMDVSIPGDETVKLFSLELDYAKEISDWLNNLPLLPISGLDAMENRIKMISDLAEKFSEKDRNDKENPNHTQVNSEIKGYITEWIYQLPLDSKKEIIPPILIQQLMKRIDRAKNAKFDDSLKINQTSVSPKKRKSLLKASKHKPSCHHGDKVGQSGQLVVDAIETWSNNLPIQAENKDNEKYIKDAVARKLYEKVGNLIVDPEIKNDDDLFEELFGDEINAQLENLSQHKEIQKKKEFLKTALINKVMEVKCIIAENTAGEDYKQKLENTIDASIPHPITNKQWYDPGFEIYKNRLAEMFILDNFDHSDDAVKERYEIRIRRAIDKYFNNVLKRNATKLTKDEIYNELYSALFKVPIPNEMSTIEEVEEVKTRCEIDTWFESLPLREASDVNELFEWDEILSMLAKRLHEIEKKLVSPDEKMRKEITKWLIKFPLLPGHENNVVRFANDLLNKLKTSKEDRKCVIATSACRKTKKGKTLLKPSKPKESSESIYLDKSGPSHKGQMWYSPPTYKQQDCCAQVISQPRKRPGELIVDIVQNWCTQLPLPAKTTEDEENNVIIRGNVGTKILLKLSELYDSSQVFQDDLLFNYLLDQELESLLSQLPLCCDFHKSKEIMKMQLKDALKSIKPLIIEDRARYAYKEELKNTISNILDEPIDTTADKLAMFDEIRNDIIDTFMQYVYHIDDNEGKQIYKAKLKDVVLQYYLDLQDKPSNYKIDPLIKQNQLLCELDKVPKPGKNAIQDEVEEIKIKEEVKEFFDELNLPKGVEDKTNVRDSLQLSLAKYLYEIERTGHNCANDSQMKKEISKCLQKLNKTVRPDKIDAFVNKLKANEFVRKSIPANEDTNQLELGSVSPKPKGFEGQTKYDVGGNSKQYLVVPQDVQPTNRRHFNNKSSTPCSSRSGPSSIPLTTGNTGVQFDAQLSPNIAGDEGQSRARQRLNTGFEDYGQRPRRRNGEESLGIECKCGRIKKKVKRRPRCILRMPYACDECEDYAPMWMPMPYGFPPGYPYF